MKKIFYLASIAALALSSCTKDETTEATLQVTNGGIEIVASMESNDTRTQLVQNEAGGFEIVWNSEDAVYVYENAENTESEYPMAGLRFGLKDGADGTATGSFYYNANGGNVDKLSADQKYVAFYPKAPNATTLSWTKTITYGPSSSKLYNQLNVNNAMVNLPNNQNYLPKSFAPGMVPAISKSFTVNTDGTATVEMQPMVDQLMVEVHATDKIKNIYLELWEINDNKTPNDISDDTYTVLPIAGDAYPTTYLTTSGELRYYISEEGIKAAQKDGGKAYYTIKLNTGNLADNVSLKDANTYVFTIPGGILGSARNIKPFISFDIWEDNVLENYTTWTKSNNYIQSLGYLNNKGIHYYFATNSKINGDLKNGIYRKPIGLQYGQNVAGETQENGIFWFNSVEEPVVYNPAGDFIIDDEISFFQYFAEYDNGFKDDYGTNIGSLNAYVMEDLKLDLTRKNMSDLLDAAIDAGVIYHDSDLAKAIMKYVLPNSGKFPTISQFKHKFEGNGLTIVDIDQPLASRNGLFGEVANNAAINNINLSNLVAATYDEEDDENLNGKKKEKGVLGYILASEIDAEASIDNITVADVTADAVIGEAWLNHYAELTVAEGGVGEELDHLIATAHVDGSFEIKAAAWDALEDLGSVFHVIVPTEKTVDGKSVDHHVATLPEGAKYEDFTVTVDYSDTNAVLSVLAGKNLSYWTGGAMTPLKNGYNWNSKKNLGAGGAYNNYAAIQYAEELAGMNNNSTYTGTYLTRNLDLNGGNGVEWMTVNFSEADKLYGNNLTISNLFMPVNYKTNFDGNATTVVAPFASVVDMSNVVFDGVEILVLKENTKYTPTYISGLVDKSIQSIYGVTLNDLKINLEAVAQTNNPDDNRYVGWFAAWAEEGLTIVNSDIDNPKSNIVALKAMVGKLEIKADKPNQDLEAIFRNSNVSGIKTTLTKIEKYDSTELEYDFVASHVAKVFVNDNFTLYFSKYNGSKPAFLYEFESTNNDVLKNQNITVSYENDEEVVINGKNGIVED